MINIELLLATGSRWDWALAILFWACVFYFLFGRR